MVGVPRKKYIWLLSVLGIFVIITLAHSEASSMVNSLDKVVVLVNGSNSGLSEEYKNERIIDDGNSSLPTRLEQTSLSCNENPEVCATRTTITTTTNALTSPKVELQGPRSRQGKEVALLKSSSHHQHHFPPTSVRLVDSYSNSGSVTNHRNFSNNEYLPVQYGAVSEGRGFTTGILFLIFSIIQFKIVFGAMILFLAVSPLILFIMFGPMILFLVFGPMLLMMMF